MSTLQAPAPAAEAPARKPVTFAQALNTALADYFSEIEAGRRPDRDAFLNRYPDVADELESFFADKDRFDRLAEPLQVLPAHGDPPRVRYVGDYELLAEIEPALPAGSKVERQVAKSPLQEVIAGLQKRHGAALRLLDARRPKLGQHMEPLNPQDKAQSPWAVPIAVSGSLSVVLALTD